MKLPLGMKWVHRTDWYQGVAVITGLLLLLCTGCGAGSSSQGAATEALHLSGQILSIDGLPITNATITVLETGDSTTTDHEGRSSITVSEQYQNLQLEIAGSWGGSAITLTDLGSGQFEYLVQLDTARNESRLISLQASARRIPEGTVAEDQINLRRCAQCHEFRTQSACGDPTWEDLHRAVYICEPEPTPTPELPSSDDTTAQPGPRPTAKPTRRPTPAKCLSCHGDRGGPRCSSNKWRSIHGFYSCPSEKEPPAKKRPKKVLSIDPILEATLMISRISAGHQTSEVP